MTINLCVDNNNISFCKAKVHVTVCNEKRQPLRLNEDTESINLQHELKVNNTCRLESRLLGLEETSNST